MNKGNQIEKNSKVKMLNDNIIWCFSQNKNLSLYAFFKNSNEFESFKNAKFDVLSNRILIEMR